jgi:hypothetical protein
MNDETKDKATPNMRRCCVFRANAEGWRRTLTLAATGVLATACWTSTVAAVTNYLPLADEVLARRFMLRHQGSATDGRTVSRIADGMTSVTVSNRNNSLLLSGVATEGRKWMFHLEARETNSPYHVYTADLDKNGTPDIILVSDTFGCGLSPSTHLNVILFDHEGLPVPFSSDGYASYDEGGIDELLDIDGDGKAELIRMDFDGGYWVTSAYRAKDGRWATASGACGGYRFPLFTRFTDRPNRIGVTPRTGILPWSPDLANSTAAVHGRLLAYRWANVGRSEDIELRIGTVAGDRIVAAPSSWHATFCVVIDDKGGRRMALLSSGEQIVREMLNEVTAQAYGVALYGQRRRGQASPELLWAVAEEGQPSLQRR